jgi:3-oxoadipate enol-lactonase
VPTIERAGASIHYDIQGAGPPLLLGHSLFFDGRMWSDVVPALARAHRVINIDARCHGPSTGPGPFTLEDLADDWLAILDREQLDRACLAGLSLGGMTAMRLALKAPERVTAMALLDTSADEEPLPGRPVYLALGEIERRISIAFVTRPIIEKKMFGKTTRRERKDIVARGMAIINEKQPRDLYHATRAVFTRSSIAEPIRAIRTPTLVLCGEEDTATLPKRARRIAERIPGAVLKMIPAAGHVSALEQPRLVERHLLDFFARHTTARPAVAAPDAISPPNP